MTLRGYFFIHLTTRITRIKIYPVRRYCAHANDTKTNGQIAKKHGWLPTDGGKGSHIKMEMSGKRPIIIPHGELKKGTEIGILKEAGLK